MFCLILVNIIFVSKVSKDFVIESSHNEKKNNDRIAYHAY